MNLITKTFKSASEMELFISKHDLFNIHRRELPNGDFELDYGQDDDIGFNNKGRFTRPDNRGMRKGYGRDGY